MSTVTILMSTFNGEQYLEEQIESLLSQVGVDFRIVVRDDGSNDKTIDILEKYEKDGKLIWYSGRNIGSARSFLDLIKNAPSSDYYAFCDQDDVWNNDKLLNAVTMLEEIELQPALYCSGYQLVDADLNILPDNGHASTTHFNEALVASCCTGCTAVFNQRLIRILQKSEPSVILMHDDWVHKVCLAVGGKVIYDPSKTIKYRQHMSNVDGGVHTLKSRVIKILSRIKSEECIRSRQINEIVHLYGNQMSKDNLDMAVEIATYRDFSFARRLKLAFSKTIRTPYHRLNRGFRVAILMKYY